MRKILTRSSTTIIINITHLCVIFLSSETEDSSIWFDIIFSKSSIIFVDAIFFEYRRIAQTLNSEHTKCYANIICVEMQIFLNNVLSSRATHVFVRVERPRSPRSSTRWLQRSLEAASLDTAAMKRAHSSDRNWRWSDSSHPTMRICVCCTKYE